MPNRANLAIYQGDDYGAVASITDETGAPADLTGCTAQAQIRVGPADTNAAIAVEMNTSITGSTVNISIPAALTTQMVGIYAWDCQITRSDGSVSTILAGNAIVTQEVTRE